ncbi:hypothetical protein MHK_003201 [Candidatus Magnetomorum sp. HK-1]|nr:hypothetical protein MHK_003201 [Candidatus Magnetomorum sp. HK-1]
MNMALQILEHEQYINNTKGKPEFIVLPIKAYQQLIDFIEDYGLGLAMKEAENSKRYSRETALRFLDDED